MAQMPVERGRDEEKEKKGRETEMPVEREGEK